MGVERNTSRCQTLDMLFHPVNSSILKTRKGKHEWIKREQTPEQAVKEDLSYDPQKQISLPEVACAAHPLLPPGRWLLPRSGTAHQGTGSNDLQIG